MVEKKFDQLLGIRTDGIRKWRGNVPYNRYEPTPYVALEKLFQAYRIEEEDEVVDFGCGRGRVSFYIHHRFQVPVTGIENNDKTFEEALDNEASYRRDREHITAPLELEYGLAEMYEIEETENCFYFFNPFSVNIFKKVVDNIMTSIKQHDRPVDLILYYPLPEYKWFLKQKTPFRLINKVRVPEANHGKRGKFKIYRYV